MFNSVYQGEDLWMLLSLIELAQYERDAVFGTEQRAPPGQNVPGVIDVVIRTFLKSHKEKVYAEGQGEIFVFGPSSAHENDIILATVSEPGQFDLLPAILPDAFIYEFVWSELGEVPGWSVRIDSTALAQRIYALAPADENRYYILSGMSQPVLEIG